MADLEAADAGARSESYSGLGAFFGDGNSPDTSSQRGGSEAAVSPSRARTRTEYDALIRQEWDRDLRIYTSRRSRAESYMSTAMGTLMVGGAGADQRGTQLPRHAALAGLEFVGSRGDEVFLMEYGSRSQEADQRWLSEMEARIERLLRCPRFEHLVRVTTAALSPKLDHVAS